MQRKQYSYNCRGVFRTLHRSLFIYSRYAQSVMKMVFLHLCCGIFEIASFGICMQAIGPYSDENAILHFCRGIFNIASSVIYIPIGLDYDENELFMFLLRYFRHCIVHYLYNAYRFGLQRRQYFYISVGVFPTLHLSLFIYSWLTPVATKMVFLCFCTGISDFAWFVIYIQPIGSNCYQNSIFTFL